MPTRLRDELRRRWRRTVYLTSQVRWFAVLAIVAALAGIVLSSAWHLSTELVLAVGALALTLAVLALREE